MAEIEQKQEEFVSLFALAKAQRVVEETAKSVTKSQIRTLMKSPMKNAKQLQDISWYLFYTSGQYRRNLCYLANLLTFDYFSYPINPKATRDHFDKSNEILKNLNIKYNFKWMNFFLMLLGEVYLYEVGNLFMVIPNSICTIVEVKDGVNKYAINLSKIKKADLDILPQEIVKAYENKDNYKETEYGKYMFYINNGFAFNAIYGKSTGVPLLASAFDDILSLDESKDMATDNQIAESLKLIHQEVPLDDKNKPILDADRQRQYHADTKRAVPSNIGIATSPLKLNMLSFVDSQSRDKLFLSLAKENLSDSFGISSMLFNNNGASGEALKKSIMTDEISLYDFLPMYENVINEKIKSTNFNMQFLRITHNNRWEQAKNYQATLSVGGSSLIFMAYTGLEPYQAIGLLTLERDVLKIDELITPKKTSYTMSGEETSGNVKEDGEIKEAGRNKSDEITDSTEKAKEAE